MSIGVARPKMEKKQSMLGSILPAAGGIVGTAFGGPAGGAIGSGVGQIAGAKLNQQPAGAPNSLQSDSTAMERRMEKLEADPQKQIMDSIDSLQFIEDPAQRADLAKPLLQANYLAKNQKPAGL